MNNGSSKTLFLGLVIGFIVTILYCKYDASEILVNNNIESSLNFHCKDNDYTDYKKTNEGMSVNKKISEPHLTDIKEPEYNDSILYSQFPIDFNKDIPDGWEADTSKYYSDSAAKSKRQNCNLSKSKYDIDGHLINGNTIQNGNNVYNDDAWKQQLHPCGDDAYTAATLHLSKKAKEAFNFQSRWGVNSLRPWIAQELDDNENKIWYEDNTDLDQYM